VVDPDVGRDAAVAEDHEVPVIAVVVALGGLVPLPHLVEFEIADDDVGGALDVEGDVFDRRAIGRENRETALGDDVEDAHAAGDQRGMELRKGVRANGTGGNRLGGSVDFIPAKIEVGGDLDDFHHVRGSVRIADGGDEFQRGGAFPIGRVGFRNLTAAGGAAAERRESRQIVIPVGGDGWRGADGEGGGGAGDGVHRVGHRDGVTAGVRGLRVVDHQAGTGLTGEVRGAEFPLIGQRRGAGGDDGERDAGARGHRLAGGLGGDRRGDGRRSGD